MPPRKDSLKMCIPIFKQLGYLHLNYDVWLFTTLHFSMWSISMLYALVNFFFLCHAKHLAHPTCNYKTPLFYKTHIFPYCICKVNKSKINKTKQKIQINYSLKELLHIYTLSYLIDFFLFFPGFLQITG